MKKLLIIGGILFLLVIILVFSGSKQVSASIKTTIITNKEFVSSYYLNGIVKGHQHRVWFNGTIKDTNMNINQKINKHDLLLQYYNQYGKVTKLYSQYDGYIVDIQANYVDIVDNDYYLQITVPFFIYTALNKEDILSYKQHDSNYQCQVMGKSDYAINNNGQMCYHIELTLLDKADLLINQQVVVTIPLLRTYGLVTNHKAIFSDEEGYFVLTSGYRNDLTNYKLYRVAVEVISRNEDEVLLQGYQLENISICLSNELIEELISNVEN